MIDFGGRDIQDFWVQWTPGKHRRDPLVILTTAVTEARASLIRDNTAGFVVSANHSSLDFAVITVGHVYNAVELS